MPTFQHLNPDGVFDPSAIYTHIVVPPPGRVVFFAGQWGVSAAGTLVDGGFGAQVSQAFSNVQTLLAHVDIGPAQVTKLVHYVVGLDQDRRSALHDVVGSIWGNERPASTLLGVAALAREQMLYEVDVHAVIPD